MGTDPAHRDETNFHFAAHPISREMTPTNTEITGIGKRYRNDFRQAVRKQHNGIVIRPRMKPTDETFALIVRNSTALTLRANIILTKARPQKEIWPKRVMRLR